MVPALQEYLVQMGVTTSTPAVQIAFHKQQHKKIYQRHYAQERRKKQTRVEVAFSQTDFRKLKRFAGRRYRRKYLSKFLKECTFAYLANETVEHDPKLTRELVKQIQVIGNNINQVVHQLHRTRDYQNRKYYEQLKGQTKSLHQTIQTFLQTPPQLRQQLEKLFTQVPESINDFERFLSEMKAKHQRHDSEEYQ